ncbi:pilus assembly protein N-terminal domain-containing protein [Dongia sp.]|uniref:pilus assembly protein N-terminal domain-containing protein n=1 Tax=Dongia sp. TaxID=1977262 RepID=UPI0035B23976
MRALPAVVLSLQIAVCVSLAPAALAQDVISVVWRKAQFLPIEGDPATIIIGDPSVTDISIEGPGKILIFGKVPGETSLMVLAANGDVLIDAAVVVMPENERHVSIISPSASAYTERTWNCYTRCVQVVGPGSIEYKAPARAGGGVGGGTAPGLADAAGQTAGGIATMNQDVSEGANAVAGQSDMLVTP